MNADSGLQKHVKPEMSWLPEWVKEEYRRFLSEICGPDGLPRDDADIPLSERLAFYETILTNRNSATIWPALKSNRHRWEAQLATAYDEFEMPDVDQVGDLLQSAHMAYRGFTGIHALSKEARDKLATDIAQSAKKLSRCLNQLWLGSAPEERDYPVAFAGISHDETQALLSDIAAASEQWRQEKRVLARPGAGDAGRRFFMVAMADWFSDIYGMRLDNVTAALVNCLYPDNPIDQPTVTKVIDGAMGQKSGS